MFRRLAVLVRLRHGESLKCMALFVVPGVSIQQVRHTDKRMVWTMEPAETP